MTFGQKITQLMIDHNIRSDENFAKTIGTSKSTVNRWRQGIALPTIAMAAVVSKQYDVSIDWLADDSRSWPPDRVITPAVRTVLDSVYRIGVARAIKLLNVP